MLVVGELPGRPNLVQLELRIFLHWFIKVVRLESVAILKYDDTLVRKPSIDFLLALASIRYIIALSAGSKFDEYFRVKSLFKRVSEDLKIVLDA